ncbi:hypothetical protein Back2_04820 [Nocardioides baekrokdamisoli]|uniref:DUF1697 domain-containing protein n=1 Tax=Nocardioides baekrokdamisoli TaxID=1804624 RepID=A0A3G9IJF5_9ACTN|nr:DUF1697 domain-containing protein [Nocardioides baekrokdamisoli]BBH16195.1 hypothetical protein Back2_04820 [Nocardioides baekrokdamisoli]
MAARYVALLRGINVGGRNPVKMATLAKGLTDVGHRDVRTYINSGNVVFTADQAPTESELEALLAERFGFAIPVLLRDRAAYAATVEAAPIEFADDTLRRDVLFLKDTTTPAEAMAALPDLTDGVDQVWPGPRALYFARLDAEASRSRLAKIVGTPIYRDISARNWRTTRTLLELLDA